MQKDKSLLATVTTTLYQHENLVDKVFFLFPQNYNDFNYWEGIAEYFEKLDNE